MLLKRCLRVSLPLHTFERSLPLIIASLSLISQSSSNSIRVGSVHSSLGSSINGSVADLIHEDFDFSFMNLNSGFSQGVPYKEWFVKVSYGPRWITYVLGSGIMTVIVLLAFRICKMLQITREDEIGFRVGEVGPERAPLLSHKDDDLLSRGSSYDSISHDEEEVDEWLIVPSIDGKASKEGESNSSPRRLCVICFDAPRDCFFLPCGHCATCFACGTRVVEEAGTCPICRRTMKKVRKIFTV